MHFAVLLGEGEVYGNSKFGTCHPVELALILALIKCEIATSLVFVIILY